MIPFNNLSRRTARYQSEIASIVNRVLASGHFILGPEGKMFEDSFAQWIGTAHAVGVNSGTDALALALRGLDVGEGDEVITVANTAVPTVAAIRMAGALPVFADIDDTHTIAPEELERRITPKTKAIIPVHLYGLPADMTRINEIARAHGIAVLEDAAQAHGAVIGDVLVGNFGACTAFSFYPTKNLGAFGDAGAIVTNDPLLAERLRRIRVYGEQSRYDCIEEGVNSRLDEFQAGFLSWALGHVDEWNSRRREIALRYRKNITNPLITLPIQDVGERKGVWHLFVVQVDDRQKFMKYLEEKGIGSAIHYPTPIYHHKAYEFLNIDPKEFPMTERVVPHIVSLPLFPELTDDEAAQVVETVNAYRG